jgi:two-component system sensor histidine kinase UhpB
MSPTQTTTPRRSKIAGPRTSMRWSPEALEAREGAREEERQRLARELHDELGQALTGITLELSWLEHHVPAGDATAATILEKVQVLKQLVDRATRTMRSVVTELRPEALDRLGLVPALEWQAETFGRQAGLRCRFSVDSDAIDLDHGRATAVFRIFQEILTNVARHAAASRVEITLEQENEMLILTVRDNGKGFDTEAATARSAFGLLGIRERTMLLNGTLEISSAPRRGTTVTLTIPLANRRIKPRLIR